MDVVKQSRKVQALGVDQVESPYDQRVKALLILSVLGLKERKCFPDRSREKRPVVRRNLPSS